MSKSRLFGFVAIMVLGMAAGLIYGWVLQPVRVNNTTLDSLRIDYKADYVLMVAENYHVFRDLAVARADLEKVSPQDPLESIQTALVEAQQLGYDLSDLTLIAELETALKTGTVAQGATP